MNSELTLQFYSTFLAGLPEQVEALEQRKGMQLQRQNMAEVAAGECVLAASFYKKAVDVVYEASVGELEKVANLALEFIFEDKTYKAEFKTNEARGVKTLELNIRDMAWDPPLELDIKDGTGQGVRTVVSVVLHVFYLINVRAYPILLVDEAYSALSIQYVERFFVFLKGLCEQKGFHIILISHDPRFLDYADKKYRVSDGVVEEIT